MMARGEGEDDILMFGEPSAHSVGTQTSMLECLSEIRAHNLSCSISIPLSSHDRYLQQIYGIDFDLTSRQMHSSYASHNQAANTVADRIIFPQHRLSPLQPSPVSDKQGIGFSTAYLSHKFPPSLAPTASDHTCLTTQQVIANSMTEAAHCSILSAEHIGDWLLEEEDRKSSPESHTSYLATLPAETQTRPQDYQDLARVLSGGFPLRDVLSRSHDDSHPGFLCTWRRVIKAIGPRPGLTQSAIKEEVKRYCEACIICQKIKPAREKLQMRIGTIRARPFSSYAFDVITLSEPDADGHRYILVCVDSFSRAVELFALKQANASEVFQSLYEVLCRWGTPHELRCDNAKAFTSAMIKALLRRSHVKQHLTAPYSHQSNGQVENCNRRVMDILRAMVLDDRLGPNSSAKWSLLLPQVRRVLMTRMVTQHGCTPNELACMHCPETEASIFAEESWMPSQAPDPAEPEWIANLARQHELLIMICEEKQDWMIQKLADANPNNQLRRLEVGDCVLLKMSERLHSKIQAPWAGPFLVISFPNNDKDSQMVCCQHLSTKKVSLCHLNMLKFCDMSLMTRIEEAIPYAMKDSFEYEVAEILAHRPTGPRKINGKLRPKHEYEFQCLWKDIERGEENPSWEPWTNSSLRTCEAYLQYTGAPSFVAENGQRF
jgi:transposase InsO family protein